MPLFKVWSEDKLNDKFVVAENFAELVSTDCFLHAGRVGDLTFFEFLTGGAFDRLTGNIAGNLTKNFQKSQMPRGLPGGGMGGFGIDRYIIQNCNHPSANTCQSESMGNVVRIMYSTCSFPSPVDYSTPRGRCSDHPVQVNSVITLAIDQIIASQNKNKLSMS